MPDPGLLKVKMSPLFYVWYALAITAIIGIPLGLAARIRSHQRAAWRHFLYGALVFLAAQVVFRLPFLRALHLLPSRGFEQPPLESVAQLAILALSAGVFEEVGRYAGYRLLFRGNLNRRAGLMYGLGHGWMECLFVAAGMAVTVFAFTALAGLDTSIIQFSPQQLGEIREAHSLWRPLAGGVERMAMLPIHVMFSLLVLQGLLVQRTRWLAAAIALHSAVNFSIGLAMQHIGLLQGELLAAFLAAASFAAIRRLPKGYVRAE